MPTPEQWKLWRQKRAWYERNSSRDRRRRLDAHAAEDGFFVRRPHEGEMLDGLDEGRVSVGRARCSSLAAGSRWAPRQRSGSARAAS